MKNRLISIIMIVSIALFIVSLSISFTILFRPFYYFHINHLNLVKETNYTYEEIKEAYDDMLDYTTLNRPFKTGKLKYSKEGKDHFKDCKALFMINFIILGLSTIILIIKKKFFDKLKLLNFNIEFWSSCLVLLVFIIVTSISLIIGFDRVFVVFHDIFFLGKDNWLLNYHTDEIIKILPEEYFMNCAILTITVIVIISMVIIIHEIYTKRHKDK